MRRYLTALTFLIGLIAVAARAEADEPTVTPSQIATWIEKLGDSSFQVREVATNRLVTAGEIVVGPLRDVFDDADRERVRRARSIVSTILNGRDIDSLVGSWDYVSVKLNGKDEAVGGQLRIDRKFMTIRKATGKEPYGAMAFTVDATQTTKRLDFVHKERPIRCLYKIEGDTLTLCYSSESDGPRPTRIWCEAGSATRLHVLKRAKE